MTTPVGADDGAAPLRPSVADECRRLHRTRAAIAVRVSVAVMVAAALVLSSTAPALAACGAPPPGSHGPGYPLVLEGVIDDGPNASGFVLSPATVRVVRYLVGNGAGHIKLHTATESVPGDPAQLMTTEDEPGPRIGERWLLFGRLGPDGLMETGCTPSRPLAAGEDAAAAARPTLARTGPGRVGELVAVAAVLLLLGALSFLSGALGGRRTGTEGNAGLRSAP